MGGACSAVIGVLWPRLRPLAVIERLLSCVTLLWERGPERTDPLHISVGEETSRAGLIRRVRGEESIRSAGQNHDAGEDTWR